MNLYRHGDVLLILRETYERQEDSPPVSEVVVAEGEATGHAHRVSGPGALLQDESDEQTQDVRRLYLPQGGTIYHEEHAAISLPPGVYEVRIQQTMTQAGQWARVRD